MKINDANEFGKAIRKRRKELGYSQKEVSEFTGFSISYLSDLENGKQTTELGKAIYIANLLGIDLLMEERSGNFEQN